LWACAAALFTLLPSLVDAQRRITGRVTAEGGGEPLLGASVQVVGTPLGTYTNERGEYALNAPTGSIELRFRRLGYKGTVVTVAPDRNEVNAALERDVLQLEELVITGEATSVARQNLANDVATVSTEDLTRAPAPTIDNALQGKIAGATISSNSGAPGGGIQVQLRGITTIKASIDPLYIVDGVVISNDAIASGANAITAAAAGGNASNQDNPVNRVADINPNDIERIEVLKGASASARRRRTASSSSRRSVARAAAHSSACCSGSACSICRTRWARATGPWPMRSTRSVTPRVRRPVRPATPR
jgi:outer membrane receptor protein involved in Fe transport